MKKMDRILDTIKSPIDIRKLSTSELKELADEIREFLVDAVSKTGGHLASNLGVVELTLALHKVFNTPNDKIVWDVGHQTYIHKIITGRKDSFDTLRKKDGLSGFPKRNESVYDTYDSGHSSTSISAAFGMATARDIKKESHEVISVIGDGSFTGGPAFEAINSIGQSGTKVIIVLNDNGMSISQNIGGLSEHLGRLRTSHKYRNAKEKLKTTLNKVPVVGHGLTKAIVDTKERIKYAIINDGVLFEELGLTYLGPVNGHDIDDLIAALSQAKKVDRPVVVHVITKKGKGYTPAETFPDRFHGIGPFDKETGKPISSNKATYSDLFGDAIYELACKDQRITAISAAMTDATGLGLMQDRMPGRVFDVGIAEANAVIMAAGQALSGLHPVVCIYSSFLQRAYDEMLEDVCLQNLPITFAVDRAGLVGSDGETHQGIFDISYFLTMPNMTLLAPCDGIQLKEMLEYAAELDSPCAIRYPRGAAITESLTDKKFTGSNITIRSGSDATIFAVGTMLNNALSASDILKDKGIDVGVINVGNISELCRENALNLEKNQLIVTVEDNISSGGFGEHLRANNSAYSILSISLPDKFIEQGSVDELFARYGMDPQGISDSIENELQNIKEGDLN